MGFLRTPISLLVFTIFSLMLCRLALFLHYPDYFQLTGTEVFVAFRKGLQFDSSIAVISLAPFLLLLSIPLSFFQNVAWRKFFSFLAGIIIVLLIIVSIADIGYFGEVQRHMGKELLLIGGELGFIIQLAFSSRLDLTIAGLVALGGLALLFYWCIIKPIKTPPPSLFSLTSSSLSSLFLRSLIWVMWLVLCFWLGRGMILLGKPIGYSDAFTTHSKIEQANLALNTPFVLSKEIKNHFSRQSLNLFSPEQLQLMEQRVRPNFHFQATAPEANKKNIIFILMESWSYKYIDGLAGNHYQVTPFMDYLITQSQVWDRFYAAGQRSIVGIQAALTSIPALNNQPTIGFGLEMNRMSRIAEILNAKNYRTLMMQTSNRRSFHMDGIAKVLGFSEYYGKEDIPILRDYPDKNASRFGWDYDGLMFLNQQLSHPSHHLPKQPFFAFLFTGTTHEPFANPGEEFLVYPHNQATEQGFLNTMRYSDWSIEQFMKTAAQQDWYQNTIFIFTADHVLRTDSHQLEQQFHIPLVIFAPDGSLPPKHWKNIASQYDLFPSMLELLGINEPISTFGQSLFNPQDPQPSLLLNKGDIIGMLSQQGVAQFNQWALLNMQPQTYEAEQALDKLKWRLYWANQHLEQNNWVK